MDNNNNSSKKYARCSLFSYVRTGRMEEMKCEPHFASWQTCFKVLLCLSYFTNWNSSFQVFWHPLLTWHRSKPFAFSIGLLISFDLAFSLQFFSFFSFTWKYVFDQWSRWGQLVCVRFSLHATWGRPVWVLAD